MSRIKYNSDPKKRQIAGLLLGFVLLCTVGGIVFFVPPNNVWVETGVVLLIGVTVFLLSSWLIKNKKWGGVITLASLYLLIMNRVGYLNGISFGVLLVLVGLISLVN